MSSVSGVTTYPNIPAGMPSGMGITARIAHVLQGVLEAATPQSRTARMLLIQHLIKVENRLLGIDLGLDLNRALASKPPVDEALLSTVQAAEILGYSRPYVVMLIDQKKLAGAIVTEGGHRRAPRASVMTWKDKHVQADPAHPRTDTNTDTNTDTGNGSRTSTRKAAAYQTPETEVMARIKALAI